MNAPRILLPDDIYLFGVSLGGGRPHDISNRLPGDESDVYGIALVAEPDDGPVPTPDGWLGGVPGAGC